MKVDVRCQPGFCAIYKHFLPEIGVNSPMEDIGSIADTHYTYASEVNPERFNWELYPGTCCVEVERKVTRGMSCCGRFEMRSGEGFLYDVVSRWLSWRQKHLEHVRLIAENAELKRQLQACRKISSGRLKRIKSLVSRFVSKKSISVDDTAV